MRILVVVFLLASTVRLSQADAPGSTTPSRMFSITFPDARTQDRSDLGEVVVPTVFSLRLERNLLPRQIKGGLAVPGIYEDQVLDAGAQGSNIDAGTAYGHYRPQGLPRGWSAEYRLMQQRTHDSSGFNTQQGTAGVLLSTYFDTPNYGLISANANLNTAQHADTNHSPTSVNRTQTWRIEQRNLPLTAKWSANHSAGHIYTPLPSLARGYSRTTLSSHPIEGASGEWLYGKNLVVNASAGHIGFFTGRDSQGFAIERGTLTSLGGQIKLSGALISDETPHSALALQMLQTTHLSDAGTAASITGSGTSTTSPVQRALWTSYVWQGMRPRSTSTNNQAGPVAQRFGGLRLQGNVIQNSTSTGASLDANWRSERLQHTGSAFYFQPDLRWGTANLGSDLRGISWRGDFASRAWSAGMGVELSSAITRTDRQSNFVNGLGRYRIDNRNSASASWAMRTGSAQGQSNQFTWDHTSQWGTTQWRVDSLRTTDSSISRLGVDQRWPSSSTRSVSTSLALNNGTLFGLQSRSVEWGLLASTSWSKAKLDGNLRGTHSQQGGGAGSNLNANLDLSWPLAANWSLVGQLNLIQGQSTAPVAVVAASTQAATADNNATSNNTNQTFILALRYQDRAGTATAPIGGTYGTGAGSIEGVVFLDEDNNKAQGISEKGVEGVTIVLDRRFGIRTDARGRFNFPFVAAGSHTLELIPDNVPLPWYAATSATVAVSVFVRDNSVVNFPLQKDR